MKVLFGLLDPAVPARRAQREMKGKREGWSQRGNEGVKGRHTITYTQTALLFLASAGDGG